MTVIDPQEPFGLRTNECPGPEVQPPAGVVVPETRAWPHALAFGTVDQSPVVINTLLATGTDVKSDVRDAKTPLDLLIQVLSEFEKWLSKA
ncbi:MAG: hypothetical protein U1E63_03795 [Burkholderiales bacterium]